MTERSEYYPGVIVGFLLCLAFVAMPTVVTMRQWNAEKEPPHRKGEVIQRMFVVHDPDYVGERGFAAVNCGGDSNRGSVAFVFRDEAEARAFARRVRTLELRRAEK